MRRSLSLALAACALTLAAATSAAPDGDPAASPSPRTGPIELPDLGEPADASISPAEEAKISLQVAAQLFSGDYLLEDPEVVDYVNDLGWKLAGKSAAETAPFRFLVIADTRINAFAVPGGLIGTNAGLILASSNESELAGVMGHEQAHVTQRHLARTINDTRTANLATMALMLGAILAGSANPNFVLGALALGQGVNYQRQVNYTRSHEQEADRLGIQTMAAAGYDPEGMASFFAKLEVQSRLYGAGLPEILRTHPVNTSRIAEARARAARMPAYRGRDSAEYGMVRARTQVLMSGRPNEALEGFAAQRKAGDQSHAVSYGYALALYRLGLAADAEAALSPALSALPKQVNVNLLQARILLARERPAEAVALLKQQLAQNPKSAPVLFSYAQALLDVGKPEEARNLLLENEPAYANASERHRLLADAARQQGNIPETQFQMASLAESRGDLREAIGQLQAALRLSEMPDKDRIRLQAYRDEIVARVPRSQLQELDRQRRPVQSLHMGHAH